MIDVTYVFKLVYVCVCMCMQVLEKLSPNSDNGYLWEVEK